MFAFVRTCLRLYPPHHQQLAPISLCPEVLLALPAMTHNATYGTAHHHYLPPPLLLHPLSLLCTPSCTAVCPPLALSAFLPYRSWKAALRSGSWAVERATTLASRILVPPRQTLSCYLMRKLRRLQLQQTPRQQLHSQWMHVRFGRDSCLRQLPHTLLHSRQRVSLRCVRATAHSGCAAALHAAVAASHCICSA